MSKIKNYLEQRQDEKTSLDLIIAKKQCVIIIDMMDYEKDAGAINVNESDGIIWVKSLISKIKFDDIIFDLILDYPVILYIENMKKIDKDYIELYYNQGDILFTVPLETAEIKEQVAYLERLLGGREIFKDTNHIFNKIFRLYKSDSDMDLVHLEVLISNALRDRAKVSQPARLGEKWDPVLMNIKAVVFSGGFLQGLAFENINEAIKQGLISDKDMEPSIMEKVLTGTVVERSKK